MTRRRWRVVLEHRATGRRASRIAFAVEPAAARARAYDALGRGVAGDPRRHWRVVTVEPLPPRLPA